MGRRALPAPSGCDVPLVEDVLHGGTWVPYQGDRVKPVMFGDYLGVEEHEVEETTARPAKPAV
jgi:hypothetical protein